MRANAKRVEIVVTMLGIATIVGAGALWERAVDFMRSRLAVAILAAFSPVCFTVAAIGGEPIPLKPVPSDIQKAKALKSIREIYARDYEQKAPSNMLVVARKFLREAVNTNKSVDLTEAHILETRLQDNAVAWDKLRANDHPAEHPTPKISGKEVSKYLFARPCPGPRRGAVT